MSASIGWASVVAVAWLLVSPACVIADDHPSPGTPMRLAAPTDRDSTDQGSGPRRVRVTPANGDTAPHPVRVPMRMSLPPVRTFGDSARVVGRLVNGLLVVPVSIQGKGPYWLGMDTGAMGHLRLNEALAARLGLAVQGKALASDPSGKNPRDVKLYRVDSLSIGDVRFHDVIAVGQADTMKKLPGVDGILGIDLFADLLLTLDYPRAELRLARATLPPENGADVLAYERDHGPIRLPLVVGQKTLTCDLDTGNMIAPFVFPTDFALSLPRKGEPHSGGTARTVSSTIEIRIVTLDVPLRLGSFEFVNAEAAFPSVREDGNIGSRALADMTIEIDQRNHRIRLARH
jgi:hypothetical protein